LQLVKPTPADVSVQTKWVVLFYCVREVQSALRLLKGFIDEVFLDAVIAHQEKASILQQNGIGTVRRQSSAAHFVLSIASLDIDMNQLSLSNVG